MSAYAFRLNYGPGAFFAAWEEYEEAAVWWQQSVQIACGSGDVSAMNAMKRTLGMLAVPEKSRTSR